MLDAYEKERLPITEQVSRFAMNYAAKMIKNRRVVPSDIELEGPAGDQLRAAFGQELYDLNVNQYCCEGLNFGYFYDRSPLIFYDGESHPAYSMGQATPSTVPGCRMPHFWLANGQSLYDALGSGYALLRFDRDISVETFVTVAHEKRVPLNLIDINLADVPVELIEVIQHKLILVRPDQHVAWRGDDLTGKEKTTIDVLRGQLVGMKEAATGLVSAQND